MTEEHKHDKVFDDVIICTDPPMRQWICRECGTEGVDKIGLRSHHLEYEQLIKRFRKDADV